MSRTWVIVYTGDLVNATVVRDLLAGQGLTPELANQAMGTLAPWLVGMGSMRAVKVAVPEDEVERAETIVAEFWERTGPGADRSPSPTWTCWKCGEANEDQFDVCWKCGTPRTSL